MKCLCLAHRGLYQNTKERCDDDEFTENTMVAFKRAHELGFGGIEFDVQMTHDKELVLWHDDSIMYECLDGLGKSAKICDVTYRELLDILESCTILRRDEGDATAYVWTNAPRFVATLEMIVNIGLPSFVKGCDFIVNIEVKIPASESNNKLFIGEICAKAVDIVGESHVVFSSFNLLACVELKRLCVRTRVMYLVDSGDLDTALGFAKVNGLDGIVAHVSLFGGEENYRITRPDFLDVWCYGGEFAGAAYCIVDHTEKNRE